MEKFKKFTIGDIEETFMELGNVCNEKDLDFDDVISQYGSERLTDLNMSYDEMMAGGAIPESAFTPEICYEMCLEINKVIEQLNK